MTEVFFLLQPLAWLITRVESDSCTQGQAQLFFPVLEKIPVAISAMHVGEHVGEITKAGREARLLASQ